MRDVSLEIPPGQVTTLLGRTAPASRRSCSRSAASCARAAGASLLGDDDLTRLRPEQIRAAGVAIVPEGRRLLPDLTVEDNLRVATYALGRAERAGGIAYALELFPELEKRWDIQARLLSGGEQQMVVLAQALVSRPQVRARRRAVARPRAGRRPAPRARRSQAVAASGVGVLLIEQFAHVALGLAETAYVIEGGRIRYSGTAQRLEGRAGPAPLRLPAAREPGGLSVTVDRHASSAGVTQARARVVGLVDPSRSPGTAPKGRATRARARRGR